MATQNPIEQEGTYPLPEAQLDRFMFSINLEYPTFKEEVEVVKSTTSNIEQKVMRFFQRRYYCNSKFNQKNTSYRQCK